MHAKILISLALLGLATGGQALAGARTCAPGEFRAMTYNVRLDTPADGPNRWSERRNLLVAQIELVRPQLLGMQEVLPGQRADLVSSLPGYIFVGGGRDDGKLAGEASPLAIERAAFRLVEGGMFWLSPTPEVPSLGWDAGFRRVASWARLVRRSDGAPLLALNTHWDHQGKAAREGAARQIAQWIATHRRKGEAVVLMGDFNASLDEPSLQHLLSGEGEGLALADSRAAAGNRAVGATITFNGYQIAPGTGGTIDHILLGAGASVVRYHALAEHFDGRLASDHFPVIADVAVPCRH